MCSQLSIEPKHQTHVPILGAYAPQPSGISSAVTASGTGTAGAATPTSSQKSAAMITSPVAIGVLSVAMAFIGAAVMA